MSDNHHPDTPAPSPVDRGRAADKILSSHFDILNQHLKEVEKCFKQLKPPHAVWVSYGPAEDDHGRYIGRSNVPDLVLFTEYQEKWRLCHAYLNGDNFEDLLPLSDCPIDIRLEAVHFLRELHERIVEAKEAWIPEVEEAVQELKLLCSELRR